MEDRREKLAFKTFITVSSYCAGVSSLMLLIFTLLGFGVSMASTRKTPNGYAMMDTRTRSICRFNEEHRRQVLWLLMGSGFVVAFIWIVRIWRTYRELNEVSPGRAARTFVISALLSPVTIVLQFSMAASLSGALPPSFPAELVGRWKLTRDSRSNDVAAHNAMMCNFDPKGLLHQPDHQRNHGGRCYLLITVGGGHAIVSSSNLTLHVNNDTKTTDDKCNDTQSEFAKDTINEVYQYAIRQNPRDSSLVYREVR